MTDKLEMILVEKMRKERDELRDAFEEYGWHGKHCITQHRQHWRNPCDCGFRDTWEKLIS